MKTIKISELSENLQDHLNLVAESEEVYKIATGKKEDEGVVMMSLREFNSLKETEYLLKSETNRKRLLESIAQIEKGEVISYDPDRD